MRTHSFTLFVLTIAAGAMAARSAMKSILFVAAILAAVPAFGQTTKTQDAAKSMDGFFNKSNLQTLSGCDSSTWNAIHAAIILGLQNRELPPASVKDDMAKASAIGDCLSTINQKSIQVAQDLSSSVTDLKIESFDSMNPASKNAALPFQIVEDVEKKVKPFLSEFQTLETMEGFARSAERNYEIHAEKTKYEALVARYDALVRQYNAGDRNNQRPTALHCESRIMSWGMATLDCQ